MQKFGNWEVIEPLGTGGQSDVLLVRSPTRIAERDNCLLKLMELSGQSFSSDRAQDFAKAAFNFARPDLPSELGALKVFKIPPKGMTLEPVPGSEDFEAIERLKNEIAALRLDRHGLPKILDSNEDDRWIVTELFPEGTLERHLSRYQGKVVPALRAFRSLVATVSSLHKDGYVHRDIKPANVFVRKDDELVLGDFGIVFVPSASGRVTLPEERVGPRDYMPIWGDLGERLEKVQPNFDVYMLGKLLWCMIAGRMKLPREHHRRPQFNLAAIFSDNRYISLINSTLDKCLVEEPGECLASAQELLEIVDQNLATIDQGVPLLNVSGQLVIPCRICGRGFYQDLTPRGTVHLHAVDGQNQATSAIVLRLFVCNVCTHREFFAPNFPEEAAQKGWTPWLPAKT